MKRAFLAVILLLASLAGLYGYSANRREGTYRQLIARGEAALGRDETFAAITEFSGAIAVKGDAMLGYLKRGEAHLKHGELETALKDLKRAAELDPSAPRPLELLGDVNHTLQRYDRAAERYQDYVDLDDRSPRILYKLALARYRGAQPAAAAAALRQAIALDERFAEAHYLLALCFKDLQEPVDALRSLERAVTLAPSMVKAREELAEFYGRAGRGRDRLDQLEKLKDLDRRPSREVAYGLALASTGQLPRAIRALGSVAQRHPDYAQTFVAVGRLWVETAEQNRDDRVAVTKALEALEQAGDLGESSEALTLHGRALLLASNIPLAERVLQQATEKLPVDPLAFYYLADVAERIGHLDRARRALLDYRALEGDDDERRRIGLALRVADLSARLNEPAVAVAWYERALAEGPEPAALLRYADALVRAGHPQRARDIVAKVLEADPGNRAALALNRRLPLSR